jgi:hypothetical protein
MVAASVWAVLASRRFERIGMSALAGLLCALALLTKETTAIFLAGLLIAVIVRGGWRNWQGLLLFAFVLESVAGPWYVFHSTQLIQTFSQIAQLSVNSVQSPARGSLANAGWYVWNLVNEQVLLPLTIAFLIGVVVAIRQSIGGRLAPGNVLPELLAGVFVSYVGMTYLTHKDPRYTLPALVYVAVLGTFWIPMVSRARLRTCITIAVVAIAVINFVGMSFGLGGTQRVMVALPGARNTIIFPWQLTVYENWGWLRGSPHHDGDVMGLLTGLRRVGITSIAMDPTATELDFSTAGIAPVAETAHLTVEPSPVPSPDLAYLLLHAPRAGEPLPCQRLNDGEGVYVVRSQISGFNAQQLSNPANPRQQYTFICPGHATVSYPRSLRGAAPLPKG